MNERILEDISLIEQENFEDAWNVQMLKDTLSYDYNFIIVLLDETIIILNNESLPENVTYTELNGYLIGNLVAGESELLRIAIKDKFKSKGLSNLIMNTYLKYTGDKASSYFLEVRSNNYIARKLYEKYGYQSIATRKNYYSNPVDDAVIYLRQ